MKLIIIRVGMKKWLVNQVGSVALMLLSTLSYANATSSVETFEHEPPLVRNLLQQAVNAIAVNADREATWKAANFYCEASRYGSSEARYRLGMLYAFGQGVPENLEYAASLFKSSSMHGHFESQKMLETIPLKSRVEPPCIAQVVLPAKNPKLLVVETHENTQNRHVGIDDLIDNLPSSKRWLIDVVEKVSAKYEIDPKLVFTIISVESNFKTSALSNKAAQGLMQLIPATAKRFNVKNAYNASQNIRGGVAYIRWLLAYFQGDVALAVAAYNAGEGAVNKYKGIPPYRETQKYVKKIQKRYPFETHPYDDTVTAPSPVFAYKTNKRSM
jgi:hypothetical protein